jgi:DNA polymerase III alpha subunit
LINYYLGEIRKEEGYEFVPFGDEEKRDAEEDLLGVAISFSMIPEEVYEKIGDYDIFKIGDLPDVFEGSFLGVIGNVKKTNSKKSGKEMLIVSFADDFDNISFFVWEKDIPEIEKKLIIGHIMVIPLKKFDIDSDGCFFNGNIKNVIDLSEEE